MRAEIKELLQDKLESFVTGWKLEGEYWVVRDAHNRIVVKCKNAWAEE